MIHNLLTHCLLRWRHTYMFTYTAHFCVIPRALVWAHQVFLRHTGVEKCLFAAPALTVSASGTPVLRSGRSIFRSVLQVLVTSLDIQDNITKQFKRMQAYYVYTITTVIRRTANEQRSSTVRDVANIKASHLAMVELRFNVPPNKL